MGLVATKLILRNFRNYETLELEPDPVLTVLVGPNAAGKTNIVEAMQLLTAADSFRKPQWSDLVMWGKEQASLSLRAEGNNRLLETELAVSGAGRRVYRVNGKVRRRVSEAAGLLPCVVFTPDDLRLVKDAAERRRSAIDGVGDQLSSTYMATRTEYERVLRQRNSLLKHPQPNPELLDTLTEKLSRSGFAFAGHRKRLFERISRRMSEVYPTLSNGEELSARYVYSWQRDGRSTSQPESDSELLDVFSSRRSEELSRGTTLIGPHRDEVFFAVGGRDARTFASQGQQRTIALAWKLAEVGVITEIAGQAPVLLLDDVMSELDETRRQALMSFVGRAAQTLLTTTNIGYFDDELIERAKVVTLG